MDNIEKSRKRRQKKARERQAKRRQRRESVSNIAQSSLSKLSDIPFGNLLQKLQPIVNIVGDTWWSIRHRQSARKPLFIGVGFLAVIVLLFFLNIIFSGNIGPNISTLGINLGGKSIQEATEELFLFWNDEILIDVILEDEVFAQVRPSEIGLSIDANATAEAAKDAGLAGFFFGHEVEPIITSNYSDSQSYMLSIGQQVFIPSFEAGYAWQAGKLVSVSGRASRELNIALSIQRIVDTPLEIINNQRVELVTDSTAPRALDAEPYFDQAYNFVTSNFFVEGYDPFTDVTEYWGTTESEMANWLVVTDNGLAIREEGLEGFVDTLNDILDVPENARYLDPSELYESIDTAFRAGEDSTTVRIRYQDTTYVLESGDWGQRLARRTGIPFFNIESANPAVDWDQLLIGQRINIPSRDLVLPLDPVPNKRIVVDLRRLWLVAYEDGEAVYHWPISDGRSNAPTAPGIFQILDKTEVAYGSSFALCNDNGECGQWEMNYFMSIYEVGIGLTNGFHGGVKLPNGNYLDGGSQQLSSTFGCVMSDDEQAKILYDWADEGVVVEIVDSDFAPVSETAHQAMDFITEITGQA